MNNIFNCLIYNPVSQSIKMFVWYVCVCLLDQRLQNKIIRVPGRPNAVLLGEEGDLKYYFKILKSFKNVHRNVNKIFIQPFLSFFLYRNSTREHNKKKK